MKNKIEKEVKKKEKEWRSKYKLCAPSLCSDAGRFRVVLRLYTLPRSLERVKSTNIALTRATRSSCFTPELVMGICG